MRIVLGLALIIFAIFVIVDSSPNSESDDGASDSTELLQKFNDFKRACIPRGGNCDDRRNDCCHNSACRCNLWGTNCRCQRVGLFQKWG